MRPPVYIGGDPGMKGAICILEPRSKATTFLEPPYDRVTITELIALFKDYDPMIFMVENVSSIPGASAGSNFKFGVQVGRINMLAELSGIGVDLVRPKAWQKKIGVTKKGPAIKKDVAGIAKRLYPSAQLFGPRGGLLDGRADALMIAHCAFLQYTGTKNEN